MTSDGTVASLIVIIFIIISLITILGFNIQHIKQNWKKYRCNPTIMPIAQFFNVDAKKNHEECAASFQSSFMDSLLAPIKGGQLAQAQNSHKTASQANDTKKKANDTKFKLTGLMSGLFNKTNNILIEFNRMGYSMKDIWHRISGIFILVQYMFDTVINQLTSTSSTIHNANKITSTSTSCFKPNTIIKTISGNIEIQHLKPGTILDNNTTISSILELDGTQEDIYKLDDVIVTGSHPVYYKKWINVHQHPNAKLLPDIKLDKVYCLNTTNKTIQLHNTLFRDWDEISIDSLIDKYPEYSNTALECENGLHKNTLIVLEDGSTKPICEIKVGENLLKTKVFGIVKIYGPAVALYKSNQIIASKNALISNKKTRLDMREPYLYHLITYSKFFWVKGNKLQLIHDYDSKVDD